MRIKKGNTLLLVFAFALLAISSLYTQILPAMATTPSTVGTSTSAGATSYPFQRKSSYANGLFWVFYSDGTNMVYCTSADGATWSSSTTVRACTSGSKFSVCLEGTNKVHYAYASASISDGDFKYRRGTLNNNGTISWDKAEQNVGSQSYWVIYSPSVVVDSDGYPWVAYWYTNLGGEPPYWTYWEATKSSTNDGTWVTASGFPQTFASQTAPFDNSFAIVPLTSLKMYVVWCSSMGTPPAPFIGYLYNGTAFGSAEYPTTFTSSSSAYFSIATISDDVHLVFLKKTSYDIIYVKRTYGVGWGSEVTIQSATTSSSAPVLSCDSATNLYCFSAGYPTVNHIYYQKYTASTSTWETIVDWQTEVALTGCDTLTSYYQAYNNSIGLVWMNATANPYQVRFAYLSSAGNPTLTISDGAGGTVNPVAGVYTNYTSGSTVTIYETASSGYVFSNWLVNGSDGGSSDPLSFTITGDTTVAPIFTPNPTLTISDGAGGTVNPVAGAYTNYTAGSTVTVYETPSVGCVFSSWLVNGSAAGSTNPLSFIITGNTTVQPVFNSTLTVSSGVGGTTTPVAGTYTNYTFGATVTVYETPSVGCVFSNWLVNGSDGGSSNPLSFTITGSTTVQPVFNSTLIVISGTGGTTNPTAGTYTNYTVGSTVTIYETPNSGYAFSSWLVNGTDGGSTIPLSFTITGNTTVQPVFSANPTLVIVSGTGGTTNPIAGTYINFTSGSTVNITETPGGLYFFANWLVNGSDGGSTDPLSFVITGDTVVQPIFYLNRTSIQAGLYSDPTSPVASSSFNLIGVIYYTGTTIAPANGSQTIYASRNDVVEGSTSSIGSDGTFQITILAPGEGTYGWLVYASANSDLNQTRNVYVHGITSPTVPGGPGGLTTPTPTLLFSGSRLSLGSIARGRTVTFQIIVNWTGATQVQINSVSIVGQNWTLPITMPQTFYGDINGNGMAPISMTLTIPDTASLSSQQMTLIFNCKSGTTTADVNCLVQFDVTLPPASSTPTYQVQTIVGVVLATSLGVVLYSGTRRRKAV